MTQSINYKPIEIWVKGAWGRYTAYASRGIAVDRHFEGDLKHSTLYVHPDDVEQFERLLDTLDESMDGEIEIYKARYTVRIADGDENDNNWTPFFTSIDRLNEYLHNRPEYGKITSDRVYTTYLCADRYPEFNKSGEYEVTFEHDDHGRFYCGLQTDPNTYGMSGSKKRYFPDRDWVGVGLGTATVRIIKDLPKYGFVTGKMADYTFDCLEKVLDYCWNHSGIRDNFKLRFVNSKVHGRFYMYFDPSSSNWRRFFEQTTENGTGVFMNVILGADLQDAEENTVWEETFEEAYLCDAWGGNHSSDSKLIEGVIATFDPSRFREKSNYLMVRWGESGCPGSFSTELMKAINLGVFKVLRLEDFSIRIIELNRDRLSELQAFTLEEVGSIMGEATRINLEADNSIRNKIAKGFIRVRGA